MAAECVRRAGPDDVARALKDPDGRIRENALQLSEPFLAKSAPLADAALRAAHDADAHVQFQAALTLGTLKSARVLPTLAELAHERSADPWFRIAILSSTADEASSFFHMLLAKGEAWTAPEMQASLSALIGARQKSSEISQWFAALPRLSRPDQALEGLARGLRLSAARNLKVPGVEASLAETAFVAQRTGRARSMGGVALFRTRGLDSPGGD